MYKNLGGGEARPSSANAHDCVWQLVYRAIAKLVLVVTFRGTGTYSSGRTYVFY